jgi:hypothetical protein
MPKKSTKKTEEKETKAKKMPKSLQEEVKNLVKKSKKRGFVTQVA